MANFDIGIGPQSKQEVNLLAGQLPTTLVACLRDIRSFKAWLDTKSAAELQAAPFSFAVSPDGVLQIKSAYTDLDKFAQAYGPPVSSTPITLTPAYSYDTFAQLLRRPI